LPYFYEKDKDAYGRRIVNVTILCIGKLKEDFWKAAIAEYSKRLSRFCKLEIKELSESKSDDKDEESRAIIEHIPKGSYVIALDVGGKRFSSEKMAENLKNLTVDGVSHICYIIGGSNGFNDEVRRKSDLRLSFSDFTFPHQLMRVILLEQIYRFFKINAGEQYHK